MEIRIKYSTSEGPHLLNISLTEIQNMIDTGILTVRQPTPKGYKDISFSGTDVELEALAEALHTKGQPKE